jgi:hypothetical protein
LSYKHNILWITSTFQKDVIECPPGYPAPLTPTSRKRDIFYPDKFKEATEGVNSVIYLKGWMFLLIKLFGKIWKYGKI